MLREGIGPSAPVGLPHLGDPTGALAIAGSPDRVADQIRRHVALGGTTFMIEFFGRDTLEPARLFAETVMPQFREPSTQ